MNEPQLRTKIQAGQWAVLIAAFLGWMFDGLEMGLFPLVAVPAFTSLLGSNENVGQWNGVVTSVFLLGAAAGGLVFGWLGDKIGRVKAMSASILTYAIFTGLCAFSTQAWHLVVLRFFASLGMGGEWALGVALVMECWPNHLRPLLAGFIGAASNVGFLLIAIVGLFAGDMGQSWRWMMFAGAAPALLVVFIQLLVPESQAWKLAAASAGASASNTMREIFSPALRKKTLIGVTLGGIALLGTWGSVQWIPGWVGKELMKEAEPVLRDAARSNSQIASAAGAIIGCFVGPMLGQLFGRRPVYFGLCLTSLISAFATFRMFSEVNAVFYVMVFIVGMTTASFYGWLPLYLPELFPTRVRATGQGFAFNGGRIIAAIGVLLSGQLTDAYGWAHSGAMISLVYLLGMVAIWFAPETKGKPMPD